MGLLPPSPAVVFLVCHLGAASSRQAMPGRACNLHKVRYAHRGPGSHVLGTRNMPLALCHGGPWVPEFLSARLQHRICQRKHWCGRSPGCSCNSASKCVHGDHVITPTLVWREPKSPPWFTEMPASCILLRPAGHTHAATCRWRQSGPARLELILDRHPSVSSIPSTTDPDKQTTH